MNNSRRSSLKLLGGSAYLSLEWSRPTLSSVVLPAHAMTSQSSDCSGFDEEVVDAQIIISVSGSQVAGPISAELSNMLFSEQETLTLGACENDAGVRTRVTEFSGFIDGGASEITGEFNVREFCGEVLACEQIANFTVIQNPTDSQSDEGEYQGRVVGTLRCCRDLV